MKLKNLCGYILFFTVFVGLFVYKFYNISKISQTQLKDSIKTSAIYVTRMPEKSNQNNHKVNISISNNKALNNKSRAFYEIVPYNNNEIGLMYKIVEAEATGEDYKGKALVTDVILNRLESSAFPNTVNEVITSPNQFASVSDKRVNYVNVTDETREAVNREIMCDKNERFSSRVLYFRTKQYHKIGTPLFKHGNHYFNGT